MSNPNVVIIHGNGGLTAEDLWYPETKDEIERLGLEVVAETMPDSVEARMSEWLPFMKNVLGVGEYTIVVGHSSGAVAAMRYAETNPILGSVLVAASHTDLGIPSEARSGYFEEPWDWEAIKSNQCWIAQFAAPNDPFIPIEEARQIRDQLNTEYYEKPRGHYQDIVFSEIAEVIKKAITA
jgi:predicted alpha/beta hydrolase family esterase